MFCWLFAWLLGDNMSIAVQSVSSPPSMFFCFFVFVLFVCLFVICMAELFFVFSLLINACDKLKCDINLHCQYWPIGQFSEAGLHE